MDDSDQPSTIESPTAPITDSIPSPALARGVGTSEHVFSRRKKKLFVYVASLAAMLSPLSSNVYLSSTVTISKELGVPVRMIALTLTVYMVVQGVAPSFWGPLSDTKGRRPILGCTIIVYVIANIALALIKDYRSLLAFRALQAFGGAATISIGMPNFLPKGLPMADDC